MSRWARVKQRVEDTSDATAINVGFALAILLYIVLPAFLGEGPFAL